MKDSFSRIFPERAISGFSRSNVTVTFYTFLNSIVRPEHVVLDIGAGRGSQIDDEQNDFVRNLRQLKGRCSRLIGLDVDSAVFANKYLDEAARIPPSGRLPLDTASVDVIYADWVLEHVENPEQFAAEVRRVLKPGGWFCARTPNKWGIIGLGGILIPNSLHKALLKRWQPGRQEQDIFPTFHRMNSLGQLRFAFPDRDWNNHSFVSGYEVGYFARVPILAWISYLYCRLMPSSLGLVVFAFMQKKR